MPILLLTAGLLAMTAFLPGEERAPFAVAAVSAGGAIGAIVSLGTQDAVSGFGQVSKGLGAILLVIFGIIQAVVALTAFVIGSGFAAEPARRGAGRPSGGRRAGSSGAGPVAGQPAALPGGRSAAPVASAVPGSAPGQRTRVSRTGSPYPVRGGRRLRRTGAATPTLTADRAGMGAGRVRPGPVAAGVPGRPGGPAAWEPSRSPIPPSADARSADTDPHGIPVIDPAGAPPPAAGVGGTPDRASRVTTAGRPARSADRDPTRDS